VVPPSQGPQTNPVAADSIEPGGQLKLATQDFPASWNPWATSIFDLSEVADILTPRLFAAGADGVLQWDATWLAAEPTVTESPEADPPDDGVSGGMAPSAESPKASVSAQPGAGSMTVTYELNTAAVWGDGAAVTAQDFLLTWQACTAPDPGPVCADRGFDHVTSVAEGATSTTVVVTYDGTYAEWRTTFARGPLRAGLLATPADRQAQWDSPQGHLGAFAGPFTVVSADGSQVTLAKNPLWRGVSPKLDTIVVELVPAAGLILAYLRGEIDAFQVADPDIVAQLTDVAGIELRRGTGADARLLTLNCSADSPLGDPQVRHAVLLGLDRTAVGQSDLAGLKWSGPVLNSPLWSTSQTQYEDLTQSKAISLSDAAEFSLKAAQAVLDQAGWIANTDGRRFKNGVELAWDFVIPPGDPLAENEAFVVRKQLKDLGVRVDLVYQGEDSTEASSGAASGMSAVTMTHSTDLAVAARFTSGGSNSACPASTIDADFDHAIIELDSDRRKAWLDQIAAAAWQSTSVIPLYEVPELFWTRPGLANMGPDGLGQVRWETVGWV
jgi:peptide/nickel transport system substrate-binding protein